MSAPRTAKRQRRLVVLSSDDEKVNNGTQNHENVKKDEEGEDDDYVESGRRRNFQLKERINRGVKRKITPVPKGKVACPSRTEASTTIPAVAVAPKLITNTLPTFLLQKQTQKCTQKPSSSQQKRPGQPRSLQTTHGSSPEKKRGKNPHNRPEEPSKSLHSFFARATEEERWSRKKDSDGLGAGVESSVTEETDLVEEIEDDDKEEEIVDFIEDDSYEELFASHIFSSGGGNRVQGGNKTGLHLDRRKANDIKGRQHIDTTNSTSGLGRRFLLPGGTATAEPSRARDSPSPTQLFTRGIRPWAEEYAPTNLDELVVNKRKVSDVQKWLVDVFSGKSKRVECYYIFPLRILIFAGRCFRRLLLSIMLTGPESSCSQGPSWQREINYDIATFQHHWVRDS